MDLKRCFKCLRDLPLTEFYRHTQMADGLLSKCRDCTRYDSKRHRAEHVEAIRAYDRERNKLPHRTTRKRNTFEEWKAAHPDWRAAQQRANNALRNGTLERQTLCEGCGLPTKLEKHHPDYTKPLAVLWLCKPCHVIADKIRRLTESKVG